MDIQTSKRRIRLSMGILAAIGLFFLLDSSSSVMGKMSHPLSATRIGSQNIIAILIGQVQRTAAVYVPGNYPTAGAAPLLIALHGGSGDASKMYDPETRIVEYAESHGFIAVFPDGLPKPGAPANSENYYWSDPSNITFMERLIDEIPARYQIDRRRIYFVGFSGGAKLIYRLAADPQISPRIAGIATVAGEIGGKNASPLTSPWEMIDPSVGGGLPMSALLLQGGSDLHLPSAGGFDQEFSRISVSFQNKVDVWRLFIGASRDNQILLTGAPPRVQATQYTNPATGQMVVSASDPILAHRWPEWDLMGVIWEFFGRTPTR